MAKAAGKTDTPDTQTVRRARRIYRKLAAAYPEAKCALDYRNAFELLMATILSAQCTDERVNMTTPALFKRYPTPAKLGAAKQADVEKIVKSCGFYRQKAKSLIAASRDIAEKFDGEVPADMDKLLSLRGVARKTANVVLGNAFDINEGVVVDTHVRRLTNRMGLTEAQDPVKIERELMPLFERKHWCMLSHLLIWHGRRICPARKAKCEDCPVASDCPQVGVNHRGTETQSKKR